MGIGGWKPMPASEVSKKGYGDCKALTNYMRTLLTAAGIPSYYAIIYNDDSVINFDKDFPKLDGNHVILMVPTEKNDIWLENTSQRVAFNHLSYSSHNRNVDFAGRVILDDNDVEIFNFGKYKGQKVEEVFKKDPHFYKWIMDGEFPLNTKQVVTQLKLKYFRK